MSQFLRSLPFWPNSRPVLTGSSLLFYDPGTDLEYQLDPTRFSALWQAITLVQAQALEGTGVQAGSLYQIDFGPDAQSQPQLVYLMGLDQYFDTTRGVLEVNGVRTAIENIDLGAGTWQLPKTPRQAALLTTAAVEIYSVYSTYAIPATYLNTALRIGIGTDLAVTLPALTADTVPSLLRLECYVAHGIGYKITVPGASRPLGNGESVLLAAVATPAQLPGTGFPGAPAGTAWRVLSEPTSDIDTGLLYGSYIVQLADLPAPVITVPNAALFAAVRTRSLSTGVLTRLAYGIGYTVASNVLTILAAANVQADDTVSYSYVPGGSVQAGSSYTPGTGVDISTSNEISSTRLELAEAVGGSYTLQLSDAGKLVPILSTSTVTVPSNASVPFPIGTTLYVAQDGVGVVTIAPASGVVVHTADGYKVGGQWQDVALHKRDLNTWVLKGGVL